MIKIKKHYYAILQEKKKKSYIVSEGVTTIKKICLSEQKFKKISIPSTIGFIKIVIICLPNSTISIKFSGNRKRIESFTLKGEDKIKKVGLAEGLEEIGEAAFDKTGMDVIALPKSVKKIEKGAFRRSSLDFVIYRGTKKRLL